ncbi:MAG: polysaccharide pyruvyl transferase family protein [Ruminococcus flavefaciens]|nr:polysaccharide pyruvyl transferase family protein [Ruminococcus flavefaciens]
MKCFGQISYNMYCNFTNYGSALQSWALHQTINKLGKGKWKAIFVDYCPAVLADKDPCNPFDNMWDKDEETRKMCRQMMPAIRENHRKFERFYHEQIKWTARQYTSDNFNEIIHDEKLDGFVCGGDTLFCPDEFGFDDGYYANYDCMKNCSVAYAVSFGDAQFNEERYQLLNQRIPNFEAFGLREEAMMAYISKHTSAPVQRVLDPTLLLDNRDYDKIAAGRLEKDRYLLLYSRRYNPEMEDYAEKLAEENGWKIIEISLRAVNANKTKRRMYYEAGVEEFLSLVKYAEFVITNSYHGMIFSIQYQRLFYIFLREQCNIKITELLKSLDLLHRIKYAGAEENKNKIDYAAVYHKIDKARQQSVEFLERELEICMA